MITDLPTIKRFKHIRVTNISQSFTYKMAAKINWHRYGTIITSLSPYVLLVVFIIPSLFPFLQIRPTVAFLFFFRTDYRFPGLFTDTSQHIRFLLFSFFSVFHFQQLVPCGRLS